MSAKRMTANPVKPARYRPGKAVPEDESSDEGSGSDVEAVTQQRQAPPKATSFPAGTAKIASTLSQVNLEERRRIAASEEAVRLEVEKAARAAEEEGFVTEESTSESASGSEDGSGEESGSDEEESSSEDEAPKKLLRPTFIKKDQRKETSAVTITKNDDEIWAEEEAQRKAKADAMIQEQLERDAAARAAGKKDWDDDEIEDDDQIDDTDGLDPDTEHAEWKLRELKRVKRERDAIEVAEKEREEIERRRNLTQEERDAEDKDFLQDQKDDREGKGKMGFMQKYFHKGAFFQDDEDAETLARRDIMGSRYADDVVNRELLPQYMQVRDMTKLGRKGRTRYKDLKSEDTGRYGEELRKGPRRADGTLDERFAPDGGRGPGASGANTVQVGQRRQAPKEAPRGPKSESMATHESRDTENQRNAASRHNVRTRSPSPRRKRDESHSQSPRRRRERQRSYSVSRSLSPRRERHGQRDQRKRSASRSARHETEKRVRMTT